MEKDSIYHGILNIVEDAISLLGIHAGKSYAESVNIIWNKRMRSTAGRAFLYEAKVELNPKLLHLFQDSEQSLQQVRLTLLHELAHLLAHQRHGRNITAHGNEWKQACSDLGIPGESATHQLPLPSNKQKKKWVYNCPHCQETIYRCRKMKPRCACLACCKKYNRGKFHSRFIFKENSI